MDSKELVERLRDSMKPLGGESKLDALKRRNKAVADIAAHIEVLEGEYLMRFLALNLAKGYIESVDVSSETTFNRDKREHVLAVIEAALGGEHGG